MTKSIYRPTASQLELFASVPKPVREQFLVKVQKQVEASKETPNLRQLEQLAQQTKEEYKKWSDLSEALEKANFKTCPKCGQPPLERYFYDLQHEDSVICQNSHVWRLSTGKDPFAPKEEEGKKEEEEKPRTGVFKLKAEKEIIDELLMERTKNLVTQFETITELKVSGSKGGQEFHVELLGHDDSSTSYWEKSPSSDLTFSVEKKEYKTGEKTKVDCGSPENVQAVQKFLYELLHELSSQTLSVS